MSEDFYRQFETPLDKAIDKALQEQNQRFLDDPEAQRRAEENGARWRHITEAEQAAGPYAVVIPIATAQMILDVLRDGTSSDPVYATLPDFPAKAIERALRSAEERA